MKKENIQKSDILISKAYQKFEEQFDKLDQIDPKFWKVTHSIIYICKCYKEKFDNRFVLSYKGSPSTSPEYKLCSRIWLMLGEHTTENGGERVKKYIDWFYRQYTSNKRFVSIGALAKNELIVRFENYEKANHKVSDFKELAKISMHELPKEYCNIIYKYENLSYIKTYKDLAFLKGSIDKYSPPEHQQLLDELIKNGFDLTILDKVV